VRWRRVGAIELEAGEGGEVVTRWPYRKVRPDHLLREPGFPRKWGPAQPARLSRCSPPGNWRTKGAAGWGAAVAPHHAMGTAHRRADRFRAASG